MNSIRYRSKAVKPSKVVCVGRNYAAHIAELNNQIPDQPVIFVKPNSAISQLLRISRKGINRNELIDYEAEISFLIIDNQLCAVAIGLDLTKRQTQSVLKSKGLPWERAKAFDGSAVFSNFVDCRKNINGLRLELELNGELVQQGGVAHMLNKPPQLIADVAEFMSFENADILMTGTPSGVGVVVVDDIFIGKIFDDDELLVQQQWTVQA